MNITARLPFYSLLFLIFGFFWILLSDKMLIRLSPTPEFGLKMQTYKGWFFIMITTLLIYLIVREQLKIVVNLKDKLQLSQKRYKQIVDLSHDLIWTVDANGYITFINNECYPVYGLKPEEMTGHRFNEFNQHNQQNRYLKVIEENLKKGITSMDFETIVYAKNGERMIFTDNISVVTDAMEILKPLWAPQKMLPKTNFLKKN